MDDVLVRDRYPAGVPCWIDLLTPEADAAARFYGGLLGWEYEERLPPEAPGSYRIARLGGHVVAAIGTPPPAGEPGSEWTPTAVRWNTYVAVDDADATAKAADAAGGVVLAGPYDVNVAGRTAALADPAGAVLHLWQPGRRPGVELVNAPGSWNWSNLSTPDPGAAAGFYGSVFGWETRSVDLGGDTATMFCRPGYGDFLADLEPGVRERQSSEGAPEGFADAVAWVQPAEGAEPEWAVTFAVDDTDRAAEQAEELGGAVLVPPFSAGAARIATLSDPAGAVVTVNTWSPEG